MNNQKHITLIIFIVLILVLSVFISGCNSRLKDDPNTEIRSIEFDGLNRTFRVHISDSYDPLLSNAIVFVLYGGGGSGENMENGLTLQGFNTIAEENNFIVVYPDGIENKWNDGRQNLSKNLSFYNVDDVGFLSLLIDDLSDEFHIKNGNVFFMGISNGGFMCYRLGFELPDKIKAIAPVAATNAVDLLNNFSATGTISLCIICGTEDPFVPYEGGYITIFNQTRSKITSVNDTVDFWVDKNKCNINPEIYEYPDVDPNDETRVLLSKYEGGSNGTIVYLYSIHGGVHTWPGGKQYYPEWYIGKTCRDIDANQIIWDFFNQLKDENQ